jgi:hypothetical protein
MNAPKPNEEAAQKVSGSKFPVSARTGNSKAVATVAQTLWRAEEDSRNPKPGGHSGVPSGAGVEAGGNGIEDPKLEISKGEPPSHVGSYEEGKDAPAGRLYTEEDETGKVCFRPYQEREEIRADKIRRNLFGRRCPR